MDQGGDTADWHPHRLDRHSLLISPCYPWLVITPYCAEMGERHQDQIHRDIDEPLPSMSRPKRPGSELMWPIPGMMAVRQPPALNLGLVQLPCRLVFGMRAAGTVYVSSANYP